MTDEFPPAYSEAAQPRTIVDTQIFVARTVEAGTPGVHLIIEGTSYFIEKAEARRVARRILFSDATD